MSCGHARASEHRALLYGSRDELVAAAVPFLREGVERDQRTVAVMGGGNADAIREGLGEAAARVRFRDPEDFYATPAGALSRWTVDLAAVPEGGRLRAVGEVAFPTGAPWAVREWARAEAIFSAAFSRAPVDMLCPYATTLPEAALASARATHPGLLDGEDRVDNDGFEDPMAFLRALDAEPLPEPHGPVAELRFDDQPAPARRFAAEHALHAGLSGRRLDDVRVSVSEIATNAVLHGRPPHHIRAWREDDRLVLEIEDGGAGIQSPLTGFLRPGLEQPGGRGVWIARQLCDLVEVRGAQVRLHVSLP